MAKFQILISLYLYPTLWAAKLPSYIKPCSIKDPKFDECVLKSAREAIPSVVKGDQNVNIPVLDPFLITKIDVLGGALNMAGNDITVKGMKNINLENIRINIKNKIVVAEVKVPEVNFEGKYRLKGKLVSLPIQGNGTFEATFYGLYVKYTMEFELKKLEDNEIYVIPTNFKVEFEPERITSSIHNLFNGNKVLGKAMNDFINNNWREVLKETGQPAFDALGSIVNEILKDFTKTIPYKDIFKDTE